MLNIKTNEQGDYVCNLSTDGNYYSQRNNQIDPMNSCATTSMIQALEIAGYSFPDILPNYRQPEDKLIYFIRHDKRVLAYWKSIDPNGYNAWASKTGCYFEPNEVHAVLSYGTNLFMGKTVTKFSTGVSLDSIVREILGKQKPCVMSGNFGGLNHVVTLVGCVIPKKTYKNKKLENMKFKDVKYFIIDDTFGETGNYRSGKKGNDILISPERFIAEFKELGNSRYKWCHTIK